MRLRFYHLVVGLSALVLAVSFQNCGAGFGTLQVNGGGSNTSSSEGFRHTSAEPLQIHSQPAPFTNSKTSQFEITADNRADFDNNQIVCSLDGVESSCKAYAKSTTALATFKQITLAFENLSDGAHVLSIRDALTEANYLTYQWRVDMLPPVISITPKFVINSSANDAVFELALIESSAVKETQCRLDNAAFAACVSPLTFENLAVGDHTFEVTSEDVVGNKSQVQSLRFAVLAPEANFLDLAKKPELETGAADAAFTFDVGGAVKSISCVVDSQAAVDCSTGLKLAALARGVHTLAASALDTQGAAIAQLTYSWKVVQAPTFAGFDPNRIVENPPVGVSTFKLVLSATDARYYRWEIPGQAAVLTPTGEWTFAIGSSQAARSSTYCVTAVNAAGQAKVCGTLTYSYFRYSAGQLTFKNLSLGSLISREVKPATFKVIGIRFATDGTYIYSGTQQRLLQTGPVKVLSIYNISNNGQVYDWASSETTSTGTGNAVGPEYNELGISDATWSLIATDGKPAALSESRLSKSGADVYYRGKLVPNVNSAAVKFEPALSNTVKVLKDNDSVVVVKPGNAPSFTEIAADPATFTSFDGNYYSDKSNLYFVNAMGSVTISAANTAALKKVGLNWLTDGAKYFYEGSALPDFAGPLELADKNYLAAGGKIARLGAVVPGVSSKGFKLIVDSILDDVDAFSADSKVYFYGVKAKSLRVMEGADTASIKHLSGGSRVIGYWIDDNQSFYVKMDNLTYATSVTDLGENPALVKVELIGYDILRAGTSVYIAGSKSTAVKDASTFTALGTYWYKDSQAVYNGYSSLAIVDVPVAGFEVLGTSTQYYGRNCAVNKVFFGQALVAGADCASFVAGFSDYAKDKNFCYSAGKAIGPAATTQVCASIR